MITSKQRKKVRETRRILFGRLCSETNKRTKISESRLRLKEAVGAVSPFVTGQILARMGQSHHSHLNQQLAKPVWINEPVLRHVSVRSKRISDLLVWVQHDSDRGAKGTRWQILDELGANFATLSVRGRNLAPDALVIDASFLILGLVDESNAFAMIGHGSFAVLAVLDLDECSVLSLRSLASLETEEKTLGVKSTTVQTQYFSNQIKMRL